MVTSAVLADDLTASHKKEEKKKKEKREINMASVSHPSSAKIETSKGDKSARVAAH